VAVILGTEGDGLTVGRKDRIGFDALVAGQATDVLAIKVADEQIIAVDKGEVVAADGRLAQHPGIDVVRFATADGSRDEQQDSGNGEAEHDASLSAWVFDCWDCMRARESGVSLPKI